MIEVEEYKVYSDQEGEEELFEHFRFKAEPGLVIIRIDKYLMDRMPNTTRNRLQNAAKNGNILVNEKRVKQNYKVKPLDEISIVLPFPMRDLELVPEDIPIEIIYEDDDLAVVNKPSNMVVHPGHGNYTGTLVHALAFHFNNLPDKSEEFFGRPGLVHRLDKHTTGLMVIAKTEHALTHLAKQFFDRTTERLYWALVWGDAEEAGKVTGNLGRSLKNRKLVTVFPDGDYGKHAVTHYKPIRNFGLVTLVECKLETGRTHQIRAHMKHIGHTLFHDLEYGGDSVLKGMKNAKYSRFIDNCFKLIDGQALHAKTLGFEHPVTKEYMQFDSELPTGFSEIIRKWETYTKELP
ncbi:MAG: RluA family pseudouridine synthase [Crocinitomicaceae bacterium]|jgi:23S rRNA pseudouridine1911/1915/1917 synthase|nr:RluA family pseudouridine synthase [Crocinitomicaceae bacterium]MDG1346594.1 RluA family pseudouridine synthase [Crocinitomicaceae bacterium]MDG2464068.1 RluA family pseudouridine synthase [Crocinitomicaceae bacterium]